MRAVGRKQLQPEIEKIEELRQTVESTVESEDCSDNSEMHKDGLHTEQDVGVEKRDTIF